jgi:hypothetical protein
MVSSGNWSRSHEWSEYSDGEFEVLWYRQFDIWVRLTCCNKDANRCSGIIIEGDICSKCLSEPNIQASVTGIHELDSSESKCCRDNPSAPSQAACCLRSSADKHNIKLEFDCNFKL